MKHVHVSVNLFFNIYTFYSQYYTRNAIVQSLPYHTFKINYVLFRNTQYTPDMFNLKT